MKLNRLRIILVFTVLSSGGIVWLLHSSKRKFHLEIKATPRNVESIFREEHDIFSIQQKTTKSNLNFTIPTNLDNKLTQSLDMRNTSFFSFGVLLSDSKQPVWQNLSAILQFGRKKYGVISASTPVGDSISKYNYVFSLPLAILAWKRIGYGTIVLVSGSEKDWTNDPCLKVIKEYMNDLNAVTLFLNVPQDNAIMISQVSRIYAASLLSEQLQDEDYLVTSDVDLWPVDRVAYALDQSKKILVLNAGCCGSFTHKGMLHRLIAMGNVGASVKTWREIIVSKGDKLPSNASEILDIFVNEFGETAKQRTVKGENAGWYLDQHMLTLLVSSWMSSHDISLVQFMPRNVGMDRVDRSWWSTDTINGKIDIHVLDNIHLTSNWLKVLPLFRLMFGTDEYSSLYSMTLLYFNDFVSAMGSKSSVP